MFVILKNQIQFSQQKIFIYLFIDFFLSTCFKENNWPISLFFFLIIHMSFTRLI